MTAYHVVPETGLVSLDLASALSGLSTDGLASLLFSEPGERPVLRSAIVDGEELVDLRDLGRFGVVAPRPCRKGVRR